MIQPLISVIVPIYNVEKYLRACVDSILAQNYSNLEVILVDDGSPDGCPAICDEYARQDIAFGLFIKKMVDCLPRVMQVLMLATVII